MLDWKKWRCISNIFAMNMCLVIKLLRSVYKCNVFMDIALIKDCWFGNKLGKSGLFHLWKNNGFALIITFDTPCSKLRRDINRNLTIIQKLICTKNLMLRCLKNLVQLWCSDISRVSCHHDNRCLFCKLWHRGSKPWNSPRTSEAKYFSIRLHYFEKVKVIWLPSTTTKISGVIDLVALGFCWADNKIWWV